MKNLLNLNGVHVLGKEALIKINGGGCDQHPSVPPGYGICIVNNCPKVYPCSSQCPDGTDPFCNT